jgi:uncharacterized repeat protein (TIGR01451 family)
VANIGAVNLFANGASVVYYDDMSLTGAAGACDSPGDISWLSVSPSAGSTGPGESSDVTVVFDATGLMAGDYEGSLCVASNDAATPLVVVPVTLAVEAAVYGVEAAAEESALSGAPGDSVTYTLWITNTGNVEDTFDLTAVGVWPADLSAPSITLASGASGWATVTVMIPGGAADGDMDTTTFTAVSQADAAAMASVDLTTTAVVSIRYLYLPIILRN